MGRQFQYLAAGALHRAIPADAGMTLFDLRSNRRIKSPTELNGGPGE
jgi:hypothetical protein